ncbi:MAG: FAD-binding oxidoreductase, partial [Silicimonas sp.]|nr:FAD-binding oxidoreductase [Silicimonas sp.]
MPDVTICGAGVFGLSVAWEILRHGASVTVIDPNGPGAGASGGVVGALQPHTPDPWNDKKQFQLESLLSAERFWQGVEAASGVPSGYARVGRLQPLSTEREIELARSRAAAASERWGPAATWEIIDRASAGDWAPPSPTGFFLHDTLSAILHPRHATQSLAAAITARGGTIAKEAPLGPAVVWATGWLGLTDLGAALGQPVGTGVKGQALLLGYNAAGSPQVFAEGIHFVPHL